MKRIISIVCLSCITFVSSIYLGLLASLHYFWYPDWPVEGEPANMHRVFVMPLTRALNFFTIAVPIMCVASLFLIYAAWRTNLRWPALWAGILILIHTLVSIIKLMPLNDTIIEMIAANRDHRQLLIEWMEINDFRLILTTIVWALSLVMVYQSGQKMRVRDD